MNAVFISDHLTETEYEQDDFLRLACAPETKWDNLAKKHSDKYGWLAIRYFIGDRWTKEDILARLSETNKERAKIELENRLNGRKERELGIEKVISNFSDNDKVIINQIRKSIFIRTKRGEYFHESAALIRPFLDKVAQELGVTYMELISLSSPEIIKALRGEIDYKKCIKNRQESFLIYHDLQNGSEVLEGKEAENFVSKHSFLKMAVDNVSEIKGNIAHGGKIKGVVKILILNQDMQKVNAGDILVTPMTTANLLPAMEKAGAFITDEGGITCHAAIIAREMKKPCIIGTKIATKVLKDGDEVEVDAERGVVRILKRNGEVNNNEKESVGKK